MNDDQRSWFKDFAAQIEQELGTFLEADPRFDASRLLGRFRAATERLLERGLDHLSEFNESHNELCAARWILGDPAESECAGLAYEPAFPECKKRIDFRADFAEGHPVWVEVKTIRPLPRDAWPQFARVVREDLLPENVVMHLEKEWMGGELWHNSIVSRARFLEHASALETTIRDCKIEGNVVLALFTNGFSWHFDQLEDFVFFYRAGRHHQGDPFGKMEVHFMEQEGIELSGQIRAFAYFRRPDRSVLPDRVKWDVKVPDLPWLWKVPSPAIG